MSGTMSNFVQLAGDLYMYNTPETFFLNSLGSGGRVVNNFNFALSSTFTLASGTQDSVTETESMASPSSFENYTRTADENTCQIIQKYVRTSYKALSADGALVGNSDDYTSIAGENAIQDIHKHNVDATMAEIYQDLNYACWNGTYQRAANTTTAGLTRGLNAAITTNVTDAGVTLANLTKAKIDAHLIDFAMAGHSTAGMVLWVNPTTKVKISDLYSLNLQTQPRDRTVGGVNVQMLVTDFGEIPIAVDIKVPAKKLFFINMNNVRNVWCPIPGKGNLFYEAKADDAAAITGMIYGQWGLDYGSEISHSVITTT